MTVNNLLFIGNKERIVIHNYTNPLNQNVMMKLKNKIIVLEVHTTFFMWELKF